jgi:hypothetical protein
LIILILALSIFFYYITVAILAQELGIWDSLDSLDSMDSMASVAMIATLKAARSAAINARDTVEMIPKSWVASPAHVVALTTRARETAASAFYEVEEATKANAKATALATKAAILTAHAEDEARHLPDTGVFTTSPEYEVVATIRACDAAQSVVRVGTSAIHAHLEAATEAARAADRANHALALAKVAMALTAKAC